MWAKGYPLTQYFSALNDLMGTIWRGSFGTTRNTMATLAEVTPLIFTGVANAVAFRSGLFNIGVAGQFVLGMMAAAMVGTIPGLSPVIHIPLIIISGIVAGGLWGAIPGYLKAKVGTHEVINTIMMNFIAMHFTNYLTMGPFHKQGSASTELIQKSAELFRFLGPHNRLSIGIFIGVIFAVLVYILFWKTTIGYEIRAVGLSPTSAEYGGISIKKNIILSMRAFTM